MPDAAFATASDSGVSATSGRSAAWAGRTSVMLVAASIAITYAMGDGATAKATAAPAMASDRIA